MDTPTVGVGINLEVAAPAATSYSDGYDSTATSPHSAAAGAHEESATTGEAAATTVQNEWMECWDQTHQAYVALNECRCGLAHHARAS